jgi:uncharacterized protein
VRSQPNPWSGKTALITGASSGIGLATARRLAAGGLRVLLVARRTERLAALVEEIRQAGGQADFFTADLETEAGRRATLAWASQQAGLVDVLVNNAGLGWYGYAAEMGWEVAHSILEVNAAATLELCLLLLPEMRKRGQGRIINVGSITGILHTQGSAVYAGSKACVDAFTTALHRELNGSGVKVSLVRPGPVKTEFAAAISRLPGSYPLPGDGFAVSPEQVADCVWSLLQRPRRVAHVPWSMAFIPWMEPLFGRMIDLLGPVLLRKARKT